MPEFHPGDPVRVEVTVPGPPSAAQVRQTPLSIPPANTVVCPGPHVSGLHLHAARTGTGPHALRQCRRGVLQTCPCAW